MLLLLRLGKDGSPSNVVVSLCDEEEEVNIETKLL